jgi:lysophospholipase L1-like esterase
MIRKYANMFKNLILFWAILALLLAGCGGGGVSATLTGGGSESNLSAQQTIVFAGASSIGRGNWSSYFGIPIVNNGVDGKMSSGLLATIEGYVASKPDKIFIMIGTNDVLNNTPGQVVNNISLIIDKIRATSPNTLIFIHSILPNKYTDKCIIIEGLNQQIQVLCEMKKVRFISIYSLFKSPSTVIVRPYFISDGLHLTNEGYQVWANAIKGLVMS